VSSTTFRAATFVSGGKRGLEARPLLIGDVAAAGDEEI